MMASSCVASDNSVVKGAGCVSASEPQKQCSSMDDSQVWSLTPRCGLSRQYKDCPLRARICGTMLDP